MHVVPVVRQSETSDSVPSITSTSARSWLRVTSRCSLGTPKAGLRTVSFRRRRAVPRAKLRPEELTEIGAKVRDFAPTGFQIRGIPSGAEAVLAGMVTGDFLLLLESTEFRYVGQVIHRASELCWNLSDHIWGEQRFPILILLQGELIDYSWAEFVAAFGFAATYHMRGNTMRLADERLIASRFGSEEAFVAALLASKCVHAGDLERDFSAFGNNLTVHLSQVRARERQRAFRQVVLAAQGGRCALCGLDFLVALDAAHVVPKEEEGTDDPRNGLALCAVHHRLFDADLFGIEPGSLRVVPRSPYSLEQLRIRSGAIDHLPRQPHATAIAWRWSRFAALSAPGEQLPAAGRPHRELSNG